MSIAAVPRHEPIPRFITAHRFALRSVPTSALARHAARQARAALAAASAHGAAIALAAALLERAALLARQHVHRNSLPRLRQQLRCIVQEGADANCRRRSNLRKAVARIVFADAGAVERLRQRVDLLERLAGEESEEMRDESRRLRSVVLATREYLNVACRANNDERLSAGLWADLDGLLADAVAARNDARGGSVDAACAAIGDAVAIALRSSSVPVSVGHVGGVDMAATELRAVTGEILLRGGPRVCADLVVGRTKKAASGLRLTSRLMNVGTEDVYVLGVTLSVAPSGVLVPIYAKLPAVLLGHQSQPADVLYETVVDEQPSNGEWQVVWHVHASP